jgi:hypothetical protein
MDTNKLNNYLLEIVQESSKELLKIYHNKSNRETNLIFPKYTKGQDRISEQEFRFTFIHFLKPSKAFNLFFSVETPTEKKYKFSKDAKGERSASSDLSFYNGEDKVMNIEFKANPTAQYSINKDIQKLTTENINGAWIHLIDGEDKGTIERLFEKFKIAFNNFPTSKKPISFHILILKSKKLLSRKGKECETDYSKNIFNINYELWKNLKYESGNGKYEFYDGKELTTKNNKEVDWQVEVFDI